MPVAAADRLELRLPPEVKARIRRAAEFRGQSLTRFALEALTHAANGALAQDAAVARRSLGWAVGTAGEKGDILAPAADPDDWTALRE